MAEIWPDTLPQAFQQDGFSEGVADGLSEYQPDVGPAITRRRTTAATRPMSGNMLMTADQLAMLRTFYDTTLLGGALPFVFPDQVRAGSLLVKFPKGSGPSWTAVSGETYRVNISITVLP